LLVERADNWTLERMAVTDRNILRLGAFESSTPKRRSASRSTKPSNWQALRREAVAALRERRAGPVYA